MPLVVCKVCKRAFINSAQGEATCAKCKAKIDELYPKVRNFLRDNEKTVYTVYDVSKILGIDLKDIEGLVELGLIKTSAGKSILDTMEKSVKIRPLDPAKAKEILEGSKSSMHIYHKKKDKRPDKKRDGD